MASKRVALVACKDSNEGPWTSAKGNERGVVVSGLGEYEQVIVQVETVVAEQLTFLIDDDGLFILPDLFERAKRYRIVKANGRGSPTTVEIFLDESAQGQSRNTDHRRVRV